MTIDRRAFMRNSVAALLASTVPFDIRAEDRPREGGTFIVNLEPEPSSFLFNSNTAGVLAGQVVEGLVEYDRDYKPVPALAERWEASPDGLTITFHLRRGVKWHDGKPFTSADVQYTVLEVVKKVNPRAGTAYKAVQAVDTPDPYTAIFRLSEPSPAIWAVLSAGEAAILPRHLYEGKPPLTNEWNNKLIGTGPFVFKEWQRGDYILLERNPEYWGGKPHLNRVRIKTITDPGARAAALEAGEVHYSPFSPVAPSEVARLKTVPGLRIETGGYGIFVPQFFFDFNLDRPQFRDKRLRTAFAHAIDRQAMADKVWFGLAKVATGPIPSAQAAAYTSDTTQYPYDPARAEQLLDAAGLPRKADGVRLRITHHTMPYGDVFKRVGEFLKESLKQVGVEVELVNLDLGQFHRTVFGDRNFDTFSTYYAAGADPQFGVLRRYWTKTIAKGVPWSNGTGYSNPALDKIIEASFTENDPARRRDLLVQFQKIAQDDLPSINLLELQHYSVVSTRVHGLSTFPDGYAKSFKDIWLEARS
ncbi:ABC transporter substrate-binding protein [Achromobacter aloeverae]|uniref:ABC transporter substrate-binding protein n=1 Tax=Achromobacter aloeverae TaxID=1750518 RepID=A0A4Q1HN57_9BURK|nr:ABC transporter substrate-binding protein [Achromobacter aloeverae]RXN91245.1 ABC transporter substrate-binding protein [Achromobacter aloeverae]